MTNIRIGVLINSMTLPAWIARSLALILTEPGLEIVVIAKDVRSRRGSTGGRQLRRTYAPVAYSAWNNFDLHTFKNQRDAFRLVDMTVPLAGIPILEVAPKRSGVYDEFGQDDALRLQAMQIDVLVQFGFGELHGDILSSTPCGVWVFQYAHRIEQDEFSPGTWEVLTGKPTTRSGSGRRAASDRQHEILVLQQSRTDADPVLAGHSAGAVYWKTAEFLPRKLCELRDQGIESFVGRHADFDNDDSDDGHGSLSVRDSKTVITRLVALFGRKLRINTLDKLYRMQWILLYQFNDSRRLAIPVRDYKQLVPPDNRIWTAPFVYQHKGRHAVFIEERAASDSIGHLSVINFDDQHEPILPPVPILKRPYHLSHPHVLEDQGTLYMVPETTQNRTIELYRSVRFPDAWEFVVNLMTDVMAVDTAIWNYAGKYWMFTNMKQSYTSSSDQLFLYYSEDLLSDRWHPHPLNPIVSDARSARQAGPLFEVDGLWYRPSRGCSDVDGNTVRIHRIDLINEMYYQETQVSSLDLDSDADIVGTRSISHMGGLTCFDAMTTRRRSRMLLKGVCSHVYSWLGRGPAGGNLPAHPFPSWR